MTVPHSTPGGVAGEDDQQDIDWDTVEMGPLIVHPLRLKLPDLPMSSFRDDAWSLRPMDLNRGYMQNLLWVPQKSDQQYVFPSQLVMAFKRVVWLFINKPSPAAYLAGRRARLWPAPSSINRRFGALRRFAHFLGEQGITQFCDVSADLLDTYATSLLTQEPPLSPMGITVHLGDIATIAHLSEYLPEPDRMIEPSWNGRNLFTTSRLRGADNSTEIIHPDTFAALLWWSQQIVKCGPDIIAAADWLTANCVRDESMPQKSTAGLFAVGKIVDSYGGVLPEGICTNEVAGLYLAALHGGGFHPKDFNYWRKKPGKDYSTNPDLAQPIPVPVTCNIEGRPWLPYIDFRQVREGKLQRILKAAAAVLICTCTGMRGEECVKLSRGDDLELDAYAAHQVWARGLVRAARDRERQQPCGRELPELPGGAGRNPDLGGLSGGWRHSAELAAKPAAASGGAARPPGVGWLHVVQERREHLRQRRQVGLRGHARRDHEANGGGRNNDQTAARVIASPLTGVGHGMGNLVGQFAPGMSGRWPDNRGRTNVRVGGRCQDQRRDRSHGG
jgi:hypothetical protein